ncbi:hypothetical protein PRK78_004605 [Emydomyces testavorans]|uniref:DJ-1/PfpI domain-containing protein n=1 Tax=Emydomyces testavorans TaxID=2070801 RepID=A0AAF0DKI9_9EURO|nr:hypothetical protein PRK78_004605 [Emydomyces testavorans]
MWLLQTLLFSLLLTVVAAQAPPKNYGVVLFPAFQALDVFGPLDALNVLSFTRPLKLSIIAATMDPVSTQARSKGMQRFNSTFGQSVVPTHTFANSPADLEVLLVPGGVGTSAPDIGPVVQYINQTYPKLKYIMSVCTGAKLLAKSGILDGRSATTNKKSWQSVVKEGPKVKWVPQARWVTDGNIWTSAGVSAGIDLMLAFLDAVYGTETGKMIADGMEYERTLDWRDDPFAKKNNATRSLTQRGSW